ncbi:MAG: diguanylate cyclase [Frankiales bacterium]|jgi:diguanylate cyclase (GGDEF)-like protein|nr:diguanylate cyclase [Frankiales bacterium]MDX6244290.1 diguanylate cyclase [Frankiales bacterium]
MPEPVPGLLDIADTLAAATTDYRTLLSVAAKAVAASLGDAAVLWVLDEDGLVRPAAFHHDNLENRAFMREVVDGRRHPPAPGGLLELALRSESPVLLARTSFDSLRTRIDAPYRPYYAQFGLSSLLMVPLRARDRAVGILGVCRDEGRPPYDEDDVLFAHRVGAQIALAVDNAQLLTESRDEVRRRRAVEAQLLELVSTDLLTGLGNRHLLLQDLRDRLNDGRRTALLLLDLDGFKDVNDALGHEVGDRVLQSVGERIQAASAASGAVPTRLGGDEFAIVCDGALPDDAWKLAEDVSSALEPGLSVDGVAIQVTASIGIAFAPEHGLDPITLLRAADLAMYRAKRLGLGVPAVYTDTMGEDQAARWTTLTELRHGLESDQLLLHYQPLLDLRDGSVRAVEALARWQHPVHGLLAAQRFIPIAEQAGLAARISFWALEEAAGQLTRWRDQGHVLQAAVNVPAQLVERPGFAQQALAVLDRHRLPPQALQLEITESALFRGPAMAALGRCQQAGISVAIDDFGTGYSSLAYLKALPANTLKLDRGFVVDIDTDPRDADIASLVVDVAHRFGMAVTAEGVETPGALALLSAIDVDLAQGYHVARPCSAEDLTVWLDNRTVSLP